MTNNIHVVAAIITMDDKVLACRRAPHKTSGGQWEFPGGKVEVGEDAFQALGREILEELELVITPVRVFDKSTTRVGEIDITLECIVCEPVKQVNLTSLDHDLMDWIPLESLGALNWAKPDLPAVEKLLLLSRLQDL